MSLIKQAEEHLEAVKEILEDPKLSQKERRELSKLIKEIFMKKRTLTEWNMHVRTVASENKGIPFNDVIKLAKETYVKPASEE